MVTRFQGSGRAQEGGLLATHKRDFEAHRTGSDWRHGAPDIDMEPIVIGVGGATVQKTIENLATVVQSDGSGFISIGSLETDGYAAGSYNVGAPGIATLVDAFNAAFSDSRLVNGGIILLLAGTYRTNTTINVPAGISIMGEIAGTIIIGEMTEIPIFKVLQGEDKPKIGGETSPGAGEIDLFAGSPIDETRFINLILADNLDGNVQSAGLPIATMQSTPMIQIEQASRVSCEGVKFIGRINQGAVSARGKTFAAIDYISGGASGSYLTLHKCFFDGFKTGINFLPGRGDADHLTVTQCRARIFGTEDPSATDSDENCFVNMSLCNFVAAQNYVVGFGTFPTQFVVTCFVISTVGTGGTDVRIHISGTTGNSSFGSGATSKSVFVDESGATSVRAVVDGNNWDSDVGNKWFITVGQGAALSDDGFGDFNGPGAIDLLLTAPFEGPTTVIVNEGTYEVTSNGNGLYNFIGNRSLGSRPIFDMNMTGSAPSDEVGNKYFEVGERIENIDFRSNTPTTGTTDFHSIRSTTTTVKVLNCGFINCALSISPINKTDIYIRNCDFDQTGSFDDNVCLLAPAPSGTILLDRCVFTGFGYIGLIGRDGGISYNNVPDNISQVIIRDCLMDQTDERIDDTSPLTQKAYFVIDDNTTSFMRVEITNTRILVENGGAQRTSVIGATPLGAFDAYWYIRARDIHIDNCDVNAPAQSNTAPIPGVFVDPRESLRVTNSRFLNGGVTFQVGPTTINTAMTGTNANQILFDGNFFRHTSGAFLQSNTLLDIDLDPAGAPSDNEVVTVINNVFDSNLSLNSPIEARHLDITGTSYEAYGVVQIYVHDIAVNFHNNQVLNSIGDGFPNSGFGTFTHNSAVVIVNANNTAGASSTNLTPVKISNNRITTSNLFSDTPTTESMTCLFVKCTELHMNDNHMAMINSGSLSGTIVACTYITTRATSASNLPAEALVTGNTFSRRSLPGVATSLKDGFIHIDSSSEEGSIHGNSFSDDTVDGTDEIVISDQSSSWMSYNNINEIKTIRVRGGHGQLAIGAGAINNPVVVRGSATPAATSFVSIDIGSATRAAVLGHRDAGSPLDFDWIVPFDGLFPVGIQIISVAVDVDVTGNGVGTSRSDLNVVSGVSDTNSSASPLTTAGHSHLLATAAQGGSGATLMSDTHVFTGNGNLGYIQVHGESFDFGGNQDFEVGEILVKYRW